MVLALSACAWDDHYAAAIQQSTIATKPDPAAQVVMQCDRLGFHRWGEAHRLCVLRGIDRLAVVNSTSYAPITVLPYAYPPLAPQHAVPVVPVR